MNLLRLPRLGLSAILLLLFAATVQAQSSAPRQTALRFLQDNPSKFGLVAADVADVKVTDEYLSKHNGVTHVWVQQQYNGIPVFNGLFGLHVTADGQVKHLSHRFVRDIASKVNTALPSLTASKAVEMAFANLGFTGFQAPSVRQKIDEKNWVFEGGAVSRADIPVSASYAVLQDGSVRLAWSMVIEQATSSDVWNMRVDAQTGLILDKINQTVYCKAGHAHAAGDHCNDLVQENTAQQASGTVVQADATYNVFALPTESPLHGGRTLLVNPADPVASPFGWHDTNGIAGEEYTYTRGNNVWAYDDRLNDNNGSASESADGGASLNFDFPYDPDGEPLVNLNAAITNLFYMNNMMHDFTYRFGFDEPAGNFQQNTYGHGGAGSDAVQANAIDGYASAQQSVNNANFSTPADGGSGRMQMFVWTRAGGQLLSVNAPAPVAGTYTVSVAASSADPFGAPVTDVPVTGDVAIGVNNTGQPTLGCSPLTNDLTGKIAIIDRGICNFSLKAYHAQLAGAVACIICNFEDQLVNMAAGLNADDVNIPVVMISKTDCDILRQFAGQSLNITLVEPPTSGPDLLDGDFDNGIIAHEYGHGISNRLTGGPNQAGCLGNAEQMGEGWSDWFSLIMTTHPGDVADKRRGVGTFVLRQNTDGVGIRRYPYSTDMSISPVTFGTVAESTEVHDLGEIWAAMTWDLYWAMVEKYGYDADLSNTNSGNARAIQLVMDGMKFQPCNPGFVDGRDAIMLADILGYDGADTCLISGVFARRGLGYFADQGSSLDASDGVENFEPIPTCIRELKIKKTTSTPLIEPGENVEFSITVTNHKESTATNVVVTDELPAGLTFSGASNGGTFSNGMVTWNLGNMPSGDVKTLTYTAKTLPNVGSNRYFIDPMDTDQDWFSLDIDGNNEFFTLQNAVVKSGTHAWLATSKPTETEFSLETVLSFTVTGTQPVMRVWTNYNTENGVDAGIVEIRKGLDPTWEQFPDDRVFRNPYPRKVDYQTFAIPFISGFSGNSNGWIQSYFDLSDYLGEEVTIRFHFGTNQDQNLGADGAFYVDEIDVMDMLNYDTEACVTDDDGVTACARAPERGVIVQPGTVVDTDEPGAFSLPMQVQPNPAYDMLHITLGREASGDVRVQLVGADGRTALSRVLNGVSAGQILTLDVQQVPAGIYVLQVESAAGNGVKKVVIR
ncbi:MAG: M36 family metallopeptidase [Saprospiraceae bacterium]